MVSVSFLFSRTNQIGSRLISWASGLIIKDLEKVPSHVALLIEHEGLQLVFESVLDKGVRIIPYDIWRTRNEECYRIEYQVETHDRVYRLINETWGKKYDWPGILFFALCFIRFILFKTPFPKENKWHSKDKYFCTEIAAKLIGYTKYSMTTPAKMCYDLIKRGKDGDKELE